MRYHYDLAGGEPIIRDIRVWALAANTIKNGTLLMVGKADPDDGEDAMRCAVSAIGATVASGCINVVGLCTEATYEVTAPAGTVCSASSTEYYAKTIINPTAVYLAEYDQASVATPAVSSGTSIYTASLTDDIDTGWLYFTATGNNTGSLRFIATSTGTLSVVDSALVTTCAGSDTCMKILPCWTPTVASLYTGGATLQAAAAAGSCIWLRISENYIKADNISMQPLRKASHKGLNSLTHTHIYADIHPMNSAYIGKC